jgi:hypothetical protein
MVRNRIPRVCFYFCSTERNSELFFLPQKSSERNSEGFLFRGIAGILSEITICSVYSVFRGIIFCRKFPTLVYSLCRFRKVLRGEAAKCSAFTNFIFAILKLLTNFKNAYWNPSQNFLLCDWSMSFYGDSIPDLVPTWFLLSSYPVPSPHGAS